MAHGGMLWSAALYNNGSYPLKNAQFGEFYLSDGSRRAPRPTRRSRREQTRLEGVLPFLQPLFRWELSQPGNVLRIFERGGRRPLETGNPGSRRGTWTAQEPAEQSRPRHAQSHRSCLHRPAEDPSAGSDAEHDRNQRPSRRLSRIGLRGLSRDLCERSVAGALRGLCKCRQPGTQRSARSDDPEEPFRTSARSIAFTRAIPTSQCMVVPHAPGHEHGHAPTRASCGGTTRPTATRCIRRSRTRDSDAERAAIEQQESRRQRAARPVE